MGRKRDEKIANMVGRPIAEKVTQLERAVRADGEQTRAEYKKQIDGIKEITDAIIDDLSARERKELYGLNTINDIANLDETERMFTVAALYTLAGMEEEVTEIQQDFIRAVQKYLDIKNPQTTVDLALIENIESISDQKALLQTMMEFLYLDNNDHSYMDEYDDVMDYFSVNRKGIKEIMNSIDEIYRAVGEQGFVEKYSSLLDEETDDGRPNEEDCTELVINKDMKIKPNAQELFEKKLVKIKTGVSIICEGELVFNKCIISYADKKYSGTIQLSKSGNLEMDSCIVIGNAKPTEYFIQKTSAEGESKSIFTNCLFKNCNKFFDLSDSDIEIKKCELENGVMSFLKSSSSSWFSSTTTDAFRKIQDCVWTIDTSAITEEFYDESVNVENLIVENCLIRGKDKAVRHLTNTIFYNAKNIKNCTFNNISKCIKKVTTIDSCLFEGCVNIAEGAFSFGEPNPILVKDCYFNGCEDIFNNFAEGDTVSLCQFTNCKNSIMNSGIAGGVMIKDCEFFNHNSSEAEMDSSDTASFGNSAVLMFIRASSDTDRSYVRNCVFDGYQTKYDFLIGGNMTERISSGAVSVEDCTFRNCTTNRSSGDIIQYEGEYLGTFGSFKTQTMVETSGCRGLNNTNCEGDRCNDFEVKTTNQSGKLIGASKELMDVLIAFNGQEPAVEH